MKRKWSSFFLGMALMAAIFMLSGAVFAANRTTSLQNVMVGGIKIVVDGTEIHPTDANGNTVEPMIYNGTTYLPVRAVAGALGKAVYWDGPSYTVYLGNMDGKLEYPTVMLKDMRCIAGTNPIYLEAKSSHLTDNYGNKYGSAMCNYYGNDTLEYLLAMKYSHFKGTLYLPDGAFNDGTLKLVIKADGHVIYTSPEMTKTSAPVAIDVDVTGYNDFIIEWDRDGAITCGLADAGFYQ